MSRDQKLAAMAERRRAAVVAGHRSDVEALRAADGDPDPTVRAMVLSGLVRAGAVTTDDLRGGLADPDPIVRRRTLELIAELQGDGAAAEVELLPLLDDADDTVVEVAAFACGERTGSDEAVLPRLCELAADASDSLVREAAVAALGAIGDPAALPTILAATRDRATVRRRAIIALAPFDGPEVDAAHERALEDRDWQVRQAAEDLLDPG